MRRSGDYLIEFLCWIAFLYSLFMAGALVVLLLDPRSREWLKNFLPEPVVWPVLYVLASASLLIGLFFLGQILTLRKSRRRIAHESSRGHIQISMLAIRSFIERLLMNEFGLKRFRVSLRPMSDGLDVRVRAHLPVGRNVLQTGERMQKIVQERVEDKIGVKVQRIEVIAQGIVGAGEVEEDEEEGTRLYTSGGELD